MKRREQISSSVDSELFLQLKEIKPPLLLSSYKIENDTLENLYNKFLVDRENPVFVYQLPEEQSLYECQDKLYALRDKIIHNKTNKSIESQYLLKIDEYLCTIRILLASIHGDEEIFEKENILRYGEMDRGDACGLIQLRKKKYIIFKDVVFDEVLATYHPSVTNKINTLKTIFPTSPFEDVDFAELYSADQVASLWGAELKIYHPGWTCTVSKTAAYVRTDNRSRTVIIPSSALFTGKKLVGLFAHEIGVHVRRREAGKSSRLQLLSIGMAGNEFSEEGLASMAEQAVGAKIRLGGTDRYIALALATGVVDGVKRDFKDTFALMEEYFLTRYKTQYDTDKAIRLSQRGAWKLCVKIFRGGDPAVPGSCLRKEKIYREGSLAMWSIFLNDPETFSLWTRGKFDLRNKAQVDLVRQCQI